MATARQEREKELPCDTSKRNEHQTRSQRHRRRTQEATADPSAKSSIGSTIGREEWYSSPPPRNTEAVLRSSPIGDRESLVRHRCADLRMPDPQRSSVPAPDVLAGYRVALPRSALLARFDRQTEPTRRQAPGGRTCEPPTIARAGHEGGRLQST